MSVAEPGRRSAYELPLPPASGGPRAVEDAADTLPESFLMRSVLWFCNLRWIVVTVLAIFGALGFPSGALAHLSLKGSVAWPWITASFLALYNLGFLWHARQLARRPTAHGARANLMCQIVLDLLVLTVVVHFVGSIETYIAFTYLFHISLACIFLSRRTSLLVAAIAAGLYLACVLLEQWGILPARGVYEDAALRREMARTPGMVGLNVGSALGIGAMMWYLTSRLSAMVRKRDSALAMTNRRLVEAQEERTRHMLHTTHELKAPFAAIDANAQLLVNGYCGQLPDEAMELAQRIHLRSRRMAIEVQEMLQLANLTSRSYQPLPRTTVDLVQVLGWCMTQVEPVAHERGVVLEGNLQAACALTVEDHMKMMFVNLLSNAVNYSNRGGHVRVTCYTPEEAGPVVSIEDEGIGIPADKLPHIFNEYYRTNEAVRQNRESSGLGLAIVRHVAEIHGVRVHVESQEGAGTTFFLYFPLRSHAAPNHGAKQAAEQEV